MYKKFGVALLLATNIGIVSATPVLQESLIYGFYSHKLDCFSQASIYKDENGDEFRVTEVGKEKTPFANADDVVKLHTQGVLTFVRFAEKLDCNAALNTHDCNEFLSAKEIAICILGK
jgi:hypothetical protein